MSATVATSPSASPRLLRGLLGSAASLYGYAKQHSPAVILANIDRLEHSFAPLTERICALGEPIVDSLDSKLTRLARVPERVQEMSLSVFEQTKLHAAALKGWLAHGLDYSQYMATVRRIYGSRWSETMRKYADDLYVRLKAAAPGEDLLVLAAHLVSEGSDAVKSALLQTWSSLSDASPRAFVERLRAVLGSAWVQSLSEKAQVFYSLAVLKEEIQRAAQAAKARASAVVRKARDVASRTSFILLRSTDRFMEASIVLLDDRVVAQLCSSPPPTVPLRGFDRLAVMEQRLHNELALFVSAKKSAVVESRPYRFLGDKVVVLRGMWEDLRTLSKEDVCAKTWPETVKNRVGGVLVFIGLKPLVRAFDRSVWEKLDQDEDKVVTVGDLLATAGKARALSPPVLLRRLVRLYRDTYARYIQFGRLNGDHED